MAANQECLSGHEGEAGKVGIAPNLHATFAYGDVVLLEHSRHSTADYSAVVLESFYQNCFESDN